MALQSHTCQCTQCRKQTGALIAPFLTVEPKNVTWSAPDGTQTPNFPPELSEFHSSTHGRRSFCSKCGSAVSWRHDEFPTEIEILVGSIDEKWLIGDRTERVKSEDLTREGVWDEVLQSEGDVGKDICYPAHGNYFFRNAIKGVTDRKLGGGKTWVENTERGLQLPD